MVYTRLDYLNEPNPELYIHERRSTFTYGDNWVPIDAIQNWENFSSLKSKFEERLRRQIEPDSLTILSEQTGFNTIYDEAGLAKLHGTAIIMPVSKALPDDTFIKPGGEISTHNPALRPDWGATKITENGYRRPIVCGDTKVGWDVLAAVNMIQQHPDGYENVPGRNVVLPLEQLQQYCLGFNIPFGFILTEEYLLCCRFTLSPDIQRSPRPKRTTVRYHHNRMLSSSTASSGRETSMSNVSFEPALVDRTAGPVEITLDRWNQTGDSREFSIKLSLWLLIMEARNHHGLV